jgi:hypothetical protein
MLSWGLPIDMNYSIYNIIQLYTWIIVIDYNIYATFISDGCNDSHMQVDTCRLRSVQNTSCLQKKKVRVELMLGIEKVWDRKKYDEQQGDLIKLVL